VKRLQGMLPCGMYKRCQQNLVEGDPGIDFFGYTEKIPVCFLLWRPSDDWSVAHWFCGHLGQVLCLFPSSFLLSTNVSIASSVGLSTRGPSGCPAGMEECGPGEDTGIHGWQCFHVHLLLTWAHLLPCSPLPQFKAHPSRKLGIQDQFSYSESL
jgi:hypothetical protein